MRNKIIKKPIYILYIFIVLNLLIGLFIVPDFGWSTDEPYVFWASGVALSTYTLEFNENLKTEYKNLGHDRFYGTASSGSIHFVEKFIFPEKDHSTKVIAHYCYFIFFQAAVLGIFLLAQHFLDDWSSLATALLFGTQPLLFGHAFINPKDIPLLTLFLLTVLAGLQMVDKWTNSASEVTNNLSQIPPEEETLPDRTKKKRRFLALLFTIFLLLWAFPWLSNQIYTLVEYGYTTKGSGLIGKQFASMTSSGSLEGYLFLTDLYIIRILRWIFFAILFLLLILFDQSAKNRLFGNFVNLNMLLASAVWGFAISTRILAVAAGGLVGLYALAKMKQKAIFPLVIYTITASIFSFITWPFLWVYGLRGYLDSLKIFNDFPWSGKVLFEGQYLDPNNLPPRFLPKLMLLQFTEPFVSLALAGILLGLFLLYKKKLDPKKWLSLYAWFFIPLLYAMYGDSTIYSNFRHFLFITPPLFIFAGIVFQQLTLQVKRSSWTLLLLLLCILPGLISIIQIHPYQYMYYNSFTGGIEGAYLSYEMDYWNTAFIYAMEYVDENVPTGSKILIWKDNQLGEVYAQKDFIFTPHTSIPKHDYQNYDYAIMPIDRIDELTSLKNYPVVHTVKIENASLIVILKITEDAE
jgi:hypothetical protein